MTHDPALAVSDAALDDLCHRLRTTRWPSAWPVDAWTAGADSVEVRRLAAYWADGYDWRAHEARINALPHRTAVVDGTPVHYLRFDAERPGELPIVLTNGWPSTFLELTDLAEHLSAPSQHGGDPADARTVIVPSLPGYPLSPQRPTLPPALQTHELWHRLLRDELGFTRFLAHGGDLGAGITSRLGEAYPGAVAGIHLLAVATPSAYDPATLTPDERAYLNQVAAWSAEEGGYQHEQSTRPLTLAHALSDSPVGLLAWILEKYHAWTDRTAVPGDALPPSFTDDFVLTQASLYWFTGTIGTSLRPYFEYAQGMTRRVERVDVPTAVAVFPHDLTRPPREWAERTHRVVRYTRMARGGHFAAREEPVLLAQDITAFARGLR
jgi:pimeloyl-ACP methyl ester carboxylesterase